MRKLVTSIICLVLVVYAADGNPVDRRPGQLNERLEKYNGLSQQQYSAMKNSLREYLRAEAQLHGKNADDVPDTAEVGDIMVSPEQAESLASQAKTQLANKGNGRQKRASIDFSTYPQMKFQSNIKYDIDANFDTTERDQIENVVNIWNSQTCILLEYNPSEADIIFQKSSASCSAYIGNVSFIDVQPLKLSSSCLKHIGVPLHEIAHTVGIIHEQSRPDRDDYTNINFDNILPEYMGNFEKYDKETDNQGIGYDFNSIMHYMRNSFAINDSIVTIDEQPGYESMASNMGTKSQFSFSTAKSVNLAYCPDACSTQLPCKNNGYTDPKDCSKCRCPDGLTGTLCDQLEPSTEACDENNELVATATEQCAKTENYQSYVLPSGSNCNWRIRTPNGERIKLRFVKIGLIYTYIGDKDLYYCAHDWIEARDESALYGRRVCRSSVIAQEHSDTDSVLVTLRKHYNSNSGRAKFCFRLDDCSSGDNNCDPNATCSLTKTSYTCACNPGYEGDGVTCTAM